MAGPLFTNQASSTLASAITSGATSLTLATGGGAAFPSPTGGNFFIGVILKAGSTSIFEIVKVTARSTDTLTITRAQEGTTALAWNAADNFALLITAGTLALFGLAANFAWGNIGGTLANQTDLVNALAAKAALSGATFTGTVNATGFNIT